MRSCDCATAAAVAVAAVVVGGDRLDLLGRDGYSDIEEGVHFVRRARARGVSGDEGDRVRYAERWVSRTMRGLGIDLADSLPIPVPAVSIVLYSTRAVRE